MSRINPWDDPVKRASILKGIGFAAKKKRAKYGNTKCEWRGQKFDSKRELERWLVLLDMAKHDEIRALVRQPEIRLVVNGVLVCKYYGDFAYTPKGQDRRVIEDSKGYSDGKGKGDAAFRIKWALAKALYPEIDWRLS